MKNNNFVNYIKNIFELKNIVYKNMLKYIV